MKLRVLDLFSGIGGFSLGLERTGGFETVAFCEIEPFPRRVLAKHWPEVPCYDDVRTLTGDVLARDGIAVDVITGGFPCQDLSLAGRQKGLDGERSGLWSEIVRLTSDLRPRYVIVENVANLLSGPAERPGRWFGRVLGDLAELGYDAEWENIPAAAVGAPHRRERAWIVANPVEIRRSAIFEHVKKRCREKSSTWASFFVAPRRVAENALVDCLGEPALFSRDDGLPDRLAKLAACGNAVVPQIPELIGEAIMRAEAENANA
jgi:DNA (cytosine-5)-methyltransferase 1